jgi:hypothetical protein
MPAPVGADHPYPKGFLRRHPLADALGCERYVPMQRGFGKGHRPAFADFVAVKTRYLARKPLAKPLLPEVPQKPSFPANESL